MIMKYFGYFQNVLILATFRMSKDSLSNITMFTDEEASPPLDLDPPYEPRHVIFCWLYITITAAYSSVCRNFFIAVFLFNLFDSELFWLLLECSRIPFQTPPCCPMRRFRLILIRIPRMNQGML